MTKFVRVLSGAYAVYTLVIVLLVGRNFAAFVSTAYADGYHGRAPFAVSVITFVILGSLSVSVTAALSYLLAVARHRKAALILAVISCIGFPVGTILGVVTLFALTRPDVTSEFVKPSNQAMQRTAR
jgi:zinc transporter ZupT